MNKKLVLILLFIFSAIFTKCEKETAPPVNLFHEYFPVDIGHYVIYEVDSIVYDDFTGEIDTFYYHVKELVESEFVDGDGYTSLRLERYIRPDNNTEWEIKNIWKARLNTEKALKTEENLTYIKLTFPPRDGKTWDGNAFNVLNEQTYKYEKIHEPYTVNNISLDSTVTVLQKDFETLVSKDFKIEVYALNIGLVYKEFVELVLEPDGSIVRGVDYSYSLKSYGKLNNLY